MSLQRSTVLLVDDQAGLRHVLARTLHNHFPVAEADNGAAALQVASRLSTSLGLVVTDVDMPVMDGLEFARVFRRREPSVPLLFITGHDSAVVAEAGLYAEALPKPFESRLFLETVTRLITNARLAMVVPSGRDG